MDSFSIYKCTSTQALHDTGTIMNFNLTLRQYVKLDNLDYAKDLDLNRIAPQDWVTLLREDVKSFLPLLNSLDNSLNVRVQVISEIGNYIADRIALTTEEIPLIPRDLYTRLLEQKGLKYFNPESVEALPTRDKQSIFLSHPVDFLDKVGYIPKLSSRSLDVLARNHPDFIDEHFDEIVKDAVTDSTFWGRLIRYDKKFKLRFLENTKTLDNKTSFRQVVRTYTDIVKLVKVEHLIDSKLTNKDWALFLNEIILTEQSDEQSVLKGWSLPNDILAELEMGLSSEVLSGKSTMSKRVGKSMKTIKVADPI